MCCKKTQGAEGVWRILGLCWNWKIIEGLLEIWSSSLVSGLKLLKLLEFFVIGMIGKHFLLQYFVPGSWQKRFWDLWYFQHSMSILLWVNEVTGGLRWLQCEDWSPERPRHPQRVETFSPTRWPLRSGEGLEINQQWSVI